MYDINYNGTAASSYGLKVTTRPNIPVPAPDIELVSIPGRSGTLAIDYGTFGDIEIAVEFNFVCENADAVMGQFSRAKTWLLGSGNRQLRFSDYTGGYYKVKRVVIDTSERTAVIGMKFTAKFLCDPFFNGQSGEVL